MSQLLFVMSRAPGTINAQEGFDALLMGSAFSECSVLFLGEGLYQLLNGQQPEPLGRKNYTLGFAALEDYGVKHIYCSESQLAGASLTRDNLILDVRPLSESDVNQLFADHDAILSF